MSFVELHARSAFSFLRGASRPEDMMERAAELGLEQMAITDRDGVYGSARAHCKAKELGMKALLGAELTLPDESVLPVLVRSRTGYQNLCRLLTRSKMRAPKGESRVEWTDLEEFTGGLLALTGDEEGPLQRALANKALAPKILERLTDIFGREHVTVELQRHRLRHQKPREAALRELAERFCLPVVASNAPCYARGEGRVLLDAFTCLRHHTTLDEAGAWLSPNAQRRIKSETEMRELFADAPEAVDATARIAERLEFTLENLGYEFPTYPVPAGHDQASFLREMAFRGAGERYPAVAQHVRDMLHFELGIISELKFDGYFLIVWDIVRWCREQGIMVQGRGSAANSVVCYALGITNADPIKYKLLFERFLSQGRTSWPDIDLDLPSGDARESVIQEMYRRYAPYGAAMTANVITYRGRSAMREMSKVLGLPPDITSRFSSLYAHGDYTHTLELRDQIAQAGMPAQHPRLPSLIKLYDMVYGLPRHLGQHSGGMVLCSGGLDSIVPLEPASMPNRTVVQWDKDDCEDLGIIKVDLLGLGMMAVLEETQALSRARGRPFEMHQIPENDPETYAMIQKADTIGLFQIESRAQQATLPRLKPKEFYDLVVEVAIIRPGPIVGNMVHPYLRRHAGREEPDYMHPDLKPVLERTLGVPW
jgi:error-prone DNA polymerase